MGGYDKSNQLRDEFPRLERRVVYVSQGTVKKKWKKLPPASHTTTREIISSVKEQSRSRKRKAGIDLATEDCVTEVFTKLIERLPRVPFPPSTEEAHFDLEGNLARISRIEEQLAANVHSMSLLRAQIAKEEALLKADQLEVKHLEDSLRSNEIYRREQASNLHPTAKEMGRDQDRFDLLGLDAQTKQDSEADLAELFVDDDLKPVLQQLQHHLDTMQNNTVTFRGVTGAIVDASGDVSKYAFKLKGNG